MMVNSKLQRANSLPQAARQHQTTLLTKAFGFTLIELMVVIAIAGILVSIAAPSFVEMTKDSRMRSEANALLGAFAYARTEAIKRGNSVHLGLGGADDGFMVWIDAAGGTANSRDAGEELRIWEPLHDTMSINSGGSNAFFIFTGTGVVSPNDTLTLCDNRTAETGRSLTVLVSGLTYLSDVTCL